MKRNVCLVHPCGKAWYQVDGWGGGWSDFQMLLTFTLRRCYFPVSGDKANLREGTQSQWSLQGLTADTDNKYGFTIRILVYPSQKHIKQWISNNIEMTNKLWIHHPCLSKYLRAKILIVRPLFSVAPGWVHGVCVCMKLCHGHNSEACG